MKSRNTRVRSKVVALLVSLTALWAFAGYVTFREGLNILWVTVTANNIGIPLDEVTAALDEERKLSVAYASGDDAAGAQLPAARQATDDTIAQLKRMASGRLVDWAASDDLKQRLADFYDELESLPDLRESIDSHSLRGLPVVQRFVTIVDSAFLVNRSLASWDDKGLAQTTNALVNIVYARELMSREDAIISGAIAAGELSAAERSTFSQIVGTRRFLHNSATAGLTGDLRDRLEEIHASPTYRQFETAENAIMAAGTGIGVDVATWRSAADEMSTSLREFEHAAVEETIQQATPVIIGTVARLVLLGVLGLAAVIASIIISITTARNLVRQLERLRNAARDLASYRLPRVVERLQAGEQVDVKQEAPPLEFGNDEIGQVGQAFNQVQETAIRVAVEQAEL
ncbi:MAG: nitrate- and nitrite sensing domain-containing protein, partial [Micromonosporaceae bacterium]|nr:nitrate- and nitrite sensing domain-containing protein [Micromonosporaceae bacterium]